MLTEDQLRALPTLRGDSQVKLLSIHCHQSLVSKPLTVETSEGHFKLPKALWSLARRAMEAVGEYEGPDEGPLHQVLLSVGEGAPSNVVPIPVREPVQDGFHQLAERLAEECFSKLKDMTGEAVRKRLESGRAALLSEAVRGLG